MLPDQHLNTHLFHSKFVACVTPKRVSSADVHNDTLLFWPNLDVLDARRHYLVKDLSSAQ